MSLIEVSELTRTFRVRGRTDVEAVKRPELRDRGRRDGRLHRPERRRQVDHDQDAHRHPGADLRLDPRGAGVDPSRKRTRLARRIGVVFGQRTTLWWDLPLRDSFDLLQKIYRTDPARHRANLARVRRAARPRRPARHPGPPAQPRPADARRHHGRAAARPRDPLPRRADDRARRGQQGPAARVPAHPQRRARHHPAAHHPRPPGHRGAVPAGDRHRPRHRGVRRRAGRACTSRAASTRTLVVDLVDEAPPIEVDGRHGPQGRGPATVAEPSRPTPRPRRSWPPWSRRTTSRTCRCRSRTSRT